jgi:PBP1b-binding outer membrane lipoprotein LpoB
MKKTIFIILITMLAFGLIFGCTNETTNAPENNDTGDVVTQPDNTNDTTDNGAAPVDEIPMPPALPE